MAKIKIGILGCANIAKRSMVPVFRASDSAEVTMIASRDQVKAKQWATDLNIAKDGSYDDLIADREIEAVYVPLPVGLHREWVLKALAAGKHVLCEKSLAGNLTEAKEMIAAARNKNLVLFEDFMCGYHPQHAAVLQTIGEGKIGEPFLWRGTFGFPLLSPDNFRYNRELGGGCLNDAGAYTVFTARQFFGEPVSVSANLNIDAGRGVDMSGAAQLYFPDGKIAQLAFDFDALYQNNYTVWGSRGLINVNRAYSIFADMKPPVELIKNENMTETKTVLEIPAANHFELIARDFCQTIFDKNTAVGQAKITTTYDQLLNQARTLEAIRLSACENRKVDLLEIN